jgi:UDP-N-acetylmuramate dehydrogenase
MSNGYFDFVQYVNKRGLGFIQTNVSLKDYTTIKIGGTCYAIFKPNNIKSLVQAYNYIILNKLDYFIIGNGSNMLISDDYHHFIFINLRGLNKIQVLNNENIISVESGVMGNLLAKKISELGFSGVEFLAGIPGTIGGIIYMNAGAWEQNISDKLISISYLDEFGKICIMKDIKNKGFGYRLSPFMKRKVIILSCEIKVKQNVNALSIYNNYMKLKKASQPLKSFSAGCAFKNPNGKKAWSLIKQSNSVLKINDASVSNLHYNFLINESNATFKDMYELLETIKKNVFNTFNIMLEEEWKIIK